MVISTVFVRFFPAPAGLIVNLLLKSQVALGKSLTFYASVSSSVKWGFLMVTTSQSWEEGTR